MADTLVNVIDPATQEVGSIPQAQLAGALQQGYQIASPGESGSAVNEQQYGTPGQSIIGALEAAGRGAIPFGATTGLEKAAGVPIEDIKGREEASNRSGVAPLAEVAGLAGSALIPYAGAANVYGKSANVAAHALQLGGEGAGLLSKVAGSAVRGGVEMALMQSGNEATRMLLNDPEQAAQSALSNIGMATGMGMIGFGGFSAVGSGVGKLAEMAGAGDLGKFVSDFKGRVAEHIDNPEPGKLLHQELSGYYNAVTNTADEVYGAQGLKRAGIEKLMPEMAPEMMNQAMDFGKSVQDSIKKMESKPNVYPSGLVDRLNSHLQEYGEALMNKESSPLDIFNAGEDLKQKLQGFAKFEKYVKPIDPAYDFVKVAKELAYKLRTGLEDSEVWGDAGTVQKDINGAFVKYLPALKDFESKFTSKTLGEAGVNEGKVASYINQLPKASGAQKKEMLGNFLRESDNYLKTINRIHEDAGLTPPGDLPSSNMAQRTLGDVSAGQKLADTMIKKGLANLGGSAIGGGIGAAIGAATGHAYLGAILGKAALSPFIESVLPAIVKPFLGEASSAQGLKAAMDYGQAAMRGQSMLQNATKNVFKAGAEVLPLHALSTERDREKLDKYVDKFSKDPEQLMNAGTHVGHYMPNHVPAIAQSITNAVTTLSQLKPKPMQGGPLDKEFPISQMEKTAYNRALDIAQQPLTVLKNIKDGTLTTSDVMLMHKFAPALYQTASQQLVNEAINHKSKGMELPYKTKISLSLFLAQPMDYTVKGSSILAAQPQQAPMPQQQPQQRGHHSSMKNINKLAEQDMTKSQSREQSRSSKA